MAADGGEHLRVVVGVAEEAAEDAPRDGERGVLDQRLGVHDLAKSQAIAVGAGAVGGVEREVARLEVVHGVAVLGAGERERVAEELAGQALRVVAVGQEVEAHAAGGELGGLLDGLGDAAERVLAHHDAVDDDLDVVAVLLLEANLLVAELAHLAVDAHARRSPRGAGPRRAWCTRPCGRGPRAPAPGRGGPARARGPCRPPGRWSGARSRGRTPGSGACPRARRAGAGSRRSRSRCPPWSGGFSTWSSGRWRPPARGRRWSPGRACPSGRGTGARSWRATPRSGAGPRRRWCRRRGSTCPSRRGP